MTRLIERDESGFWSLKGVNWRKLQEGATVTKTASQSIYGALAKLRDYEASGMDPDQVAEAAEKNKPMKPMKMLGWNGVMMYECQNCGDDVWETQKYCRYCGQRLKWEE